MSNLVKITSIEPITHDVYRIRAEKPDGIEYRPGQAVDISLNKEGWNDEIRTFTFTSIPSDDFIEFTIKTYPGHNGVTNQIRSLKAGDEIYLYDIYGDIEYKGEGVFIAGGAGITPFIAILKKLEKENQIGNNKLIFANKSKADIIDASKFDKLLGSQFINVLSDENIPGFEHGFITPEIIKKHSSDLNQYFYLCGPPPMMDAVLKHLASLGVKEENIVKEGF
ncbi:MAG: hypothetical protein J5I59_09190 [Saprospiraceae bacterium]|nr:hypothetical protein [Saprospiraceae bacterium]